MLYGIYLATVSYHSQIRNSLHGSFTVSYYFSYTINAVVQVSRVYYLFQHNMLAPQQVLSRASTQTVSRKMLR